MIRAVPSSRIVVLLLAVSAFLAYELTASAQSEAPEGGPGVKDAGHTSDVIPPWQKSSPWFEVGAAAARAARSGAPSAQRARNVILFLGDGMGIPTVTAARIRAGQLAGGTGEDSSLTFDSFPFTAFSKTYTVDHQVPDSAGTMTAIVTGVKTRSGTIGVNENVALGDFRAVAGNTLATILDVAESRGMATGIVTTTRVTHGTPAALYAKSADRQWEDDADMAASDQAARDAGVPDIARQLVEYSIGDGIEVVLGGGRTSFLPGAVADPEHEGVKGRRLDGRDLVGEWTGRSPGGKFVWNRAQLLELDPASTTRVLGLFEPEEMAYEWQRANDPAGEPSLTEMTQAAIRMLSGDPDGFFLMVEGGRIDHAHHQANAYTALGETIEFAHAVEAAVAMTSPADTLVLVTADHGHAMAISGYARRGNPILGLVEQPYVPSQLGVPERQLERDACKRPYTVLTYANGPGHMQPCRSEETPVSHEHSPSREMGTAPADADEPPKGSTLSCRPDLTNVDTTDPDYHQEGLIPLLSETHSGEDVPIYATGARAAMVHGTLEQNVIFHLMIEAMAP
jgi:alkaline phosphatase